MRELLKLRRNKLGLTQNEVAKKAGIARTTYTNIELGEKNPSLDVALKIKKILKANDNVFLNSNVAKGN